AIANAEQVKVAAGADAERVKLHAGAEAEHVRVDAAARAESTRAIGDAEAFATQAKGLAEGEAVRAKGMAEAEAIKARADALAENQDAVIGQQLAENGPPSSKRRPSPSGPSTSSSCSTAPRACPALAQALSQAWPGSRWLAACSRAPPAATRPRPTRKRSAAGPRPGSRRRPQRLTSSNLSWLSS
ncbi:MAG: hypothetical protein WKF43_14570, partial [Acidimicrobiales bacterium]